MVKPTCGVASTLLFLLFAPLSAGAQPVAQSPPAASRTVPGLPDRVFVDINGGYQTGSETFSDAKEEALSGESATWNTDYETRDAPVFDVGVGVRVWRGLVAAAAYSRYKDTNFAAVHGAIPHPFFFDKDRAISGEAADLRQQEDVVHLSAMWVAPAGRRLDVRVFAGPSLYRIQRDLVADIDYVEDYPYDTATFDRATVERVKVDRWGYHVGGDVTWMFTRSVGVGAMTRFSRVQTDMTSPASGQMLSLRFGGLQFGGGLRFRFGGSATRVEPATPAPARQPAPAPQVMPVEPLRSAVLKKASPIFVRPGALSPLRTFPAGTRLKVREEVDEWLMIEFNDPQWGVRVGYVRRENCEY